MVAKDVAAVAGLVTLSVGFGLAWLPLGFIVPGTLIFFAAILKHASEKDDRNGAAR